MALSDVLLFAGGQWQAALLYIAISLIGGVLAVLGGDWLGQWFISKARRTIPHARVTRKLTDILPELPPDTASCKSHFDIQDDMLLPDIINECETRQ